MPELKGLDDGYEIRKDWTDLFIRLAKKPKDEPSDLIWLPLIATGAAIYLLRRVTEAISKPSIDPAVHHQAITIVLIVCSIPLLVSAVWLYARLARWFFWRLVAISDQLVLINKPLFIPGGSARPVPLREIKLVHASTGRNRKEEASWRSVVAGWIRIAWLIVEGETQLDVVYHWMGPVRHAPEKRQVIKRLMLKAILIHTATLQLSEEEAKTEYRARRPKQH